MFTWIKTQYTRFNNWMASWAPGFKTRVATGLGAVGSGAAIAQEYITGMPVNKFVTTEQLGIVTLVLFTLAFWFRGLANRNVVS